MDLSVDIYFLLTRGHLDPWQVLQEVHDHLLQECPRCEAEWEQFIAEEELSLLDVDPRPRSGGPAAARHGDADPALDRPALPADDNAVGLEQATTWKALRSRMRAETWKAREDLQQLLALPREQRRAHIEKARSRFRSRTFLHYLLEESRTLVRSAPADAAHLAALVPAVLHWLPGGERPWVPALRARAEACRANAERVAGDLPAAARRFAELRRRLAAEPLENRAACAEIDSLEASLCIGQRRFPEAETLLRRAAVGARQSGARTVLARTLIQLGTLCWTRGQLEDALGWLQQAESELPPGKEGYDALCLQNSRVLVLCELERYQEAARLLEEAEPHFAKERHGEAYLAVLRGRISLGQQRWDEAADRFEAAEEILFELGRDYDTAIAVLHRAHAYLGAGDTARLRELASGLVPSFRARGVGRETLSVLRLLAEAVAADRADVALVVELHRRLRALPG